MRRFRVSVTGTPFSPRFPLLPPPDVANVVDPAKARKFFIHGVTVHGKTFRPSDWAERLCGVMAPYRPGGIASGRDAFIGYSPYVRPETVAGVKCVVVDERLEDVEKMAFNFVMNFARDNELPVYEACELPAADPVGNPMPPGS